MASAFATELHHRDSRGIECVRIERARAGAVHNCGGSRGHRGFGGDGIARHNGNGASRGYAYLLHRYVVGIILKLSALCWVLRRLRAGRPN
jgi:hypothetical protein